MRARTVRGRVGRAGLAARVLGWSIGSAGMALGLAAQVTLAPFSGGFDRVSTVTHAADGSRRLFVVERKGKIWIVSSDGTRLPIPFADLSDRIDSSMMELGLLALTFDPDYEANGRLFVAYTDPAGDAVVSRFLASSGDPDLLDPDSESEVLRLPQPSAIHNIHHLDFGPDGYLYVGSGDGGPIGDPEDNAQNLGVLLGKVLRLDVDVANGYAVPPDNPFVGEPGARDEIWAYGLRNPANFAFDRLTGELLLSDVGQNLWEEVNLQPVASRGGENYGWRRMEGSHCYDPPAGCYDPDFTLPVIEYPHEEGGDCAVIGGYRSRGPDQPGLWGRYYFGDFCSGIVRVARPGCSGWWLEGAATAPSRIGAIGEGELGEIYVAGWSVQAEGVLWRLISTSDALFEDGFESGDLSRWTKCLGAEPSR